MRSWLVYFTALRLAPLALVQSVGGGCKPTANRVASRQAGGRQRSQPWSRSVARDFVAGSHPSDRMPSPALTSAWLGASLVAALSRRPTRPRLTRAATSGLAAGFLFAVGDLATKLLAVGGEPSRVSWRLGYL